jgi:hypothetical protein
MVTDHFLYRGMGCEEVSSMSFDGSMFSWHGPEETEMLDTATELRHSDTRHGARRIRALGLGSSHISGVEV